ncbi:hypothetical protein PM082_016955 [Marasmius tenuissimus]|nr:hypothetical protein PM082_016955 [Marasmius tenuissimus]
MFSQLEQLDPNARFFLVVEITTPDSDKADEFERHVLAISKVANSDKEPGTLMYRLTRGFGPDDSNTFTVLEEYVNKAAFEHHQTSEPYKALVASDYPQYAKTVIAFRQERL